MRTPKHIQGDAATFWKRHARQCVENGTLCEDTISSFEMLCRVWGILQTTDPHEDSKEAMKFNGLLKNYFALARPFGLLGNKVPPPKKEKNFADKLKDALKITKVDNAIQDESNRAEECKKTQTGE